MTPQFLAGPMNGKARMQRRGGFTLLELMVSMIIIGIVLATVAPKVGRTMAETRVQKASQALAADIQRAFTLAAQRRSPIRISVDTANKTFRLKNRARDTTYLTTVYNSTSDIGLSRMQANDTAIVVYPSGISSNTLTLTLTAPGPYQRRVSMSKAGQIRITTP